MGAQIELCEKETGLEKQLFTLFFDKISLRLCKNGPNRHPLMAKLDLICLLFFLLRQILRLFDLDGPPCRTIPEMRRGLLI